MKALIALAAAAIFCTSALAGTTIDDPVKYVRSVYAQWHASGPFARPYTTPTDIFTPRLAGLFELQRHEGRADLSEEDPTQFWFEGQDWKLTAIKVTGTPIQHKRQIVIARFRNFDEKQQVHFYFEKSDAGWLLDDVRFHGGQDWTLSLVLKYGYDSNE